MIPMYPLDMSQNHCPCGNPCEGNICDECRQEAEERAFLHGMNLPTPE